MKFFRKYRKIYQLLTLFVVVTFAAVYRFLIYIPHSDVKEPEIKVEQLNITEHDKDIPWAIWAKSKEGRDIEYVLFGSGEKLTIILAAFHGNEPLSAELALKFAEYINTEVRLNLNCRVLIVPIVNPDGLAKASRLNANGVDLNRNFPTQNWTSEYALKRYNPGIQPGSEPETQAIIKLLDKYKADRIISIHTPFRVVNFDGPGTELANKISELNGYPVKANIGYPTPGSFGNYAGVEHNIPTITLELPEEKIEKVWEQNREALLYTINY